MKTEYRWRIGFPAPKGVDAKTAKQEMERVRTEHGTLTAEVLVQAAKPKASPLHPAFEWDNGIAGDLWRKQQAMRMIRAVEVVYADQERAPHREYVLASVVDAASDLETPCLANGYVPMRLAVRDADMCEDVLERLEREIMSAQASLDEFEAVAAQAGKKLGPAQAARKHMEKAGEALRAYNTQAGTR